MPVIGPPIDHIEQEMWKIVDFIINDDHLNSFVDLIRSQLENKSPEDLVFKTDDIVCNLESVVAFPIPGSSVPDKISIVIQFGGYEIFEGKAINVPDMMVFSIRPTYDEYYLVSGTAKLIFWDFFSAILDQVSLTFDEASEGINQYFIRTKLIRESIKDSKKQGINLSTYPESIMGKKPSIRKNRPRYDAIKRVAIALYNVQNNSVPTRTEAAKRFRTRVATITDLEFDPKVLDLLRQFTKNPASETRMRQEIMSRKKKTEPQKVNE